VRRILITGGTGFVGSHLVRFLSSADAKLIVVSSGEVKTQLPGVEYCRVDIRNADDVRAVVRGASPHQVYHLAGISSVPASWQDPRLTFDVNVIGSYNIFDAAMRLPDPPRILNVSTSQVYAPSDAALLETSPLGPDNPYAASKAMSELLAVQYQKSTKGGGIITARAFNHTGPGQFTSFALPSFAKQLAEMEVGLRPPVLKVGNIHLKRDFTDVRDVVVAYRDLLEKGAVGDIYNVCSGRAVLLADLVKELQKNCTVTVEIEVDPARVRARDVPQIVGDPGKLHRTTEWIPKVPLGRMLKELLAYWRTEIKEHAVEGNVAATETLP
jgi:GDP-4-dehydro-6-deoxy-D-mannose reductase